MYKHITKVGKHFHYAMYKYYKPLVNLDQILDTYNYMKLFCLWKRKGSELDLNMMKPKINTAIPDIQILR